MTRMQWWLTHEAPYAAFWVTAAFAVLCLVGAAVGLIGWVWFFLAVTGVVGSLRALHLRMIYEAEEAEAYRVMDRVRKRLQSSHPNGGVTLNEYVEALRAEGVADVERFAAEYPRPEEKPR